MWYVIVSLILSSPRAARGDRKSGCNEHMAMIARELAVPPVRSTAELISPGLEEKRCLHVNEPDSLLTN